MIKLFEMTPSVYYNKSRDFQLIGRLYDLVLNYIKTNTDLIYNCPYNADLDTRLIDLMSLLLGFKSKHNYNIKQLYALCGAFAEILKNKGNITSVQLAGQTLVNSEGITEPFGAMVDTSENSPKLILYVPQDLSDINLLQDILPYILPAGISCKIIRQVKEVRTARTELKYHDEVKLYGRDSDWLKDYTTSVIPRIEDINFNSNTVADNPGYFINSTVVQPINDKGEEPPQNA